MPMAPRAKYNWPAKCCAARQQVQAERLQALPPAWTWNSPVCTAAPTSRPCSAPRRSPGTLTLRAAGGLRLQQTVGAANTPNLPATTGNAVANNNINLANHAIVAGDTWHIRLTAGADLTSADTLATAGTPAAAAEGHLVLANALAGVRTGTGRIDLAAARDVRIDNVRAVVYTGGRIGAADTEAGGNNRWAIDGGDITVQISRQANLLAFQISDTGKGINGHRNRLFEGVGLNNTRLRIEKSVGRELRITDNEPHGTVVAFELPV